MTSNLPKWPDPQEPDLPKDVSRSIGGWMIALLWLLVLGGGTLLAQRWLHQQQLSRAPSWVSDASGEAALTLKADRFGQYRLQGIANGHVVHFLLDTGASEISIPGAMAQQLGLKKGRGYPVITANGTVTVYATVLDNISIGPFTVDNMRAHVNPAMEGDVALLGMSFLRHFELRQRAEKLTISAP